MTALKKTLDMSIRGFSASDIPMIVSSFAAHNWPKPSSTFETYLSEQEEGERAVWLAFVEETLAGYVTLTWRSSYQPFQQQNIPEIMDLNILPPFRGRGIGAALLTTAEMEAFSKNDIVGLGVGLYKDYGPAQKLYVTRGYIPDGRGITYNGESVPPGNMVRLDDSLVLWLVKKTGINSAAEVHMYLCTQPAEWAAARAFRQKYFFDKVPISDPYTWTFDHQDHLHFVLYQGPAIIGYAHIQLWPEARAILRIIVIDERCRCKGLGSHFLSLIERWLISQGIQKLQTHSSPEAYAFYKKNSYQEALFSDPAGHEVDPQDISLEKRLSHLSKE